MESQLERVQHEALGLPAAERAALVERLLESLETEGAAGFDEAYLAELEQRSADIDSGAVELIPWDEAMAQLRAAT